MLFEGAVHVGAFRSRPGDPSFANSGPARGHLLVFPRTCVSIQHAGRAAVVSDPTLVMIYNRNQTYTRRAVSPAGDRCDWFAFPAGAIAEVRGGADEDRPFGDLVCLPSTTRAYALAHAALRRLGDALFVEEAALALLDAVLATAPPAPPTPAHRELADAARRLIATRFCDGRSLDAIAGELGVSTFHLARVFRRTQRVHAPDASEPIGEPVPLGENENGRDAPGRLNHEVRCLLDRRRGLVDHVGARRRTGPGRG